MLTAFSTLTRIPLGRRPVISDEDLSASLLYFPFVGLLIGGFLAGLAKYLHPFFSALPLAALLLFVLVLLTGALHLDGLADLCDGLGAGGSPARMLAVMKESQVGAFGVIAVVMILLLKFSFFVELIDKGTLSGFFLMGLLSRWSMVSAAFLGKYPREAGTGRAFIGTLSHLRYVSSGLLTMAFSWWVLSEPGLLAMAFISILSYIYVRYLKRKMGGLTGDGLGALNELSEIVVLIFVVTAPKIETLFS